MVDFSTAKPDVDIYACFFYDSYYVNALIYHIINSS